MVRSEVCCRRVASQFAARNPDPLVVVDDERPIAFALATGSGVIVASSGLLRLLSGPQRAAVLAHERAHLAAHHQRFRAVARFAAALEPLLTGAPRVVEAATEQWADEEAARLLGDRLGVAETITAVATMARTHCGAPSPMVTLLHRCGALAFAPTDAHDRIAALLQSPARRRWQEVVPHAPLVAVETGATLDATHQLGRLIHAVLR